MDVITKGGTNTFHGSTWEFFRNNVLNANSYYRNANNQPKPVLDQNQFGFTLGGPVKKNKLFFFVSYEGNRQRNGLDPQCSKTVTMAPITDNRTAAAIGALFAGQTGAGGGTAILGDGSNINPVALALLQLKLPNGQYVIPTPQTVNPSLPFDSQGQSAFSVACPFTDNQFMTNADYNISERSKLSARFFFSDNAFSYTLPNTSSAGAAVPGFPQTFPFGYRSFSLTHTYVFSSKLINQAEIGFNRVNQHSTVGYPFTFSDIGSTVPSSTTTIDPRLISTLLLRRLSSSAETGKQSRSRKTRTPSKTRFPGFVGGTVFALEVAFSTNNITTSATRISRT